MRRSTAACEWSAITIIACSSRKRVEPAAGVHEPLQLAVGGGDRGDLRVRPVAVREGVVVGQREEHEVEQVVLDEVRADAAAVLVALARHPELAAAAGAAAREQVRVEQLARAQHRLALEDRAGDPRERRLVRELVAVAAAVDEVRRARRAHAGVVEALVDGRHLRRQMSGVHVVDRVGERAQHAGAAAGAEARAVLDVAPLRAVVPVHARDAVPIRTRSGRDRGGADGRDGRERGDAVVDVGAALHDRLQRSARGPARRRAPASPA